MNLTPEQREVLEWEDNCFTVKTWYTAAGAPASILIYPKHDVVELCESDLDKLVKLALKRGLLNLEDFS